MPRRPRVIPTREECERENKYYVAEHENPKGSGRIVRAHCKAKPGHGRKRTTPAPARAPQPAHLPIPSPSRYKTELAQVKRDLKAMQGLLDTEPRGTAFWKEGSELIRGLKEDKKELERLVGPRPRRSMWIKDDDIIRGLKKLVQQRPRRQQAPKVCKRRKNESNVAVINRCFQANGLQTIPDLRQLINRRL